MAQQAIRYFFVLSAILMIIVYFRGSVAVTGAFSEMVRTISYALTGRNKEGNFANYPSGG